MNDLQTLRKTIGQLFESLPELTEASFTIGGKQYRAHRSEPWVCMDAKAARGWDAWTEYPLPEYYRRKAMGQTRPPMGHICPTAHDKPAG